MYFKAVDYKIAFNYFTLKHTDTRIKLYFYNIIETMVHNQQIILLSIITLMQ